MLPIRDGVGPSQVSLPPGDWACLLDFLVERFPAIPAAQWQARMACGDVVDDAGHAVLPQQAYRAPGKLYYYRSVAHEKPNAAQAWVLFEDELLLVADKPHFLAVTPSGEYLQETLLVRLRRAHGVPSLTPLHRIDRDTAGVVLFGKQPGTCAAYHSLFAGGHIAKSYQAIAPTDKRLQFPLTHTSKLVTGVHFMQMCEAQADGAARPQPNARTRIELMETQGEWGRYRLQPLTGKRHQLRVHMAALGLPILGDRIYPNLLPRGIDEVGNPLRLLAQSLSFRDPVTHQERSFSSRRELHFPSATPA